MKRDGMLWAAVLIPPTVWFLSFGARFVLAPWACAWNSKAALFGVAIAAFLLAALPGILAWDQWDKLGRQWAGEAAGAEPRWRVLATAAIVISAVSCLLIVAQTIADGVLGACQ